MSKAGFASGTTAALDAATQIIVNAGASIAKDALSKP